MAPKKMIKTFIKQEKTTSPVLFKIFIFLFAHCIGVV